MEWDSPQLRPPFECAICGANQVVLCCGLRLATGCVGSEACWEELQSGQVQPLPVLTQGHLVGATKQNAVGSGLCWYWSM